MNETEDPRVTQHVECDCVPNLGPSHCHLCGEAAGHPVPWTEAHPLAWEYGWYDSDPSGTHLYDREGGDGRQEHPYIWWYVFGLTHDTAESAHHTGIKSTWGQPIIVRRHPGATEWEHVEEAS